MADPAGADTLSRLQQTASAFLIVSPETARAPRKEGFEEARERTAATARVQPSCPPARIKPPESLCASRRSLRVSRPAPLVTSAHPLAPGRVARGRIDASREDFA